MGGAERPQPNNFVEDALCDFALGHFRQGKIAAIARKQSDDVGIDIEARAFGGHVIGDNQISTLGG